jgi:hypothetical protein
MWSLNDIGDLLTKGQGEGSRDRRVTAEGLSFINPSSSGQRVEGLKEGDGTDR